MDSIRAIDVVNIFAIVLGPVFAVQAQKWIEKGRQKRELQLKVFRTLMATRATKTAPAHVEALNLIAIEFRDNKVVMSAWDLYIDHLNGPPMADDQAWGQKMTDLFSDLMQKMGASLKYDFSKVQINRHGYAPKIAGEVEKEFQTIRKGMIDVLAGKTSIPIHAAGGQVAPIAHPLAVSLPPQHALRELKPGDKI